MLQAPSSSPSRTASSAAAADEAPIYVPIRPWRSRMVPVRTLEYHVREWGPVDGDPTLAPLVLAHGWMDVAASYQFVVDAFGDAFMAGRRIIAADWRGFGLSRPAGPCDRHDFADYLGDLDHLLDTLVGDTPVDLVGHSMGGNVAMMYAGARPQRIRRLVNLEGFGMPATRPAQAPRRYAQWMDELRQLRSGELTLKSYAGVQEVAQRLMKTNRRLPRDKALWLAHHWAAPNAEGRWEILGDTAHKLVSAQLFRVDEMLALYAAITAPVLAVEASDDSLGMWWKERYTLAEYHERIRQIPDCRTAVVQDAGHMLHHDQPAAVAGLIEGFLTV
ncbi:Tropinesterase [Delftia tsuruhatensis]|uniref:alpha/beta fold hydrolase n=1 Tax=Delftia tsuruhatensis TaxID=180282 RepID=UPI001E6B93F9|nr:alpha/beta hydrolase [Delftia tsuruhatensis]CAB5708158.1 Tropinesterase [Delftia tsuruhatensis]CAC9680636.1 Tropinesterase [Delftia tsuruhatensis]